MDGLGALYAEQRRALGLRRGIRLREKSFRVAFRPYAGLRGVIYDRREHYDVRLSDLLRDAPPHVHESLARVLVSKIDRRLVATTADQAAYRAWARLPHVAERHESLKRARGRKRLLAPRGMVHDLEELFGRLNHAYFENRMERPRLGWSPDVSRSLYGHHDPVHDAIVINRLLDHPRVPEYVVASILHHEMLHVKHGTRYGRGGRRILHPRALRADERRFAEYALAKRFLRDVEERRIRLRPLPRATEPRSSVPASATRPLQTQLPMDSGTSAQASTSVL